MFSHLVVAISLNRLAKTRAEIGVDLGEIVDHAILNEIVRVLQRSGDILDKTLTRALVQHLNNNCNLP